MVLMLLQLAGVKVDAPYVNEIVNSVCAICVFVGLLDGGKAQDGEVKADEETQEGVSLGSSEDEPYIEDD